MDKSLSELNATIKIVVNDSQQDNFEIAVDADESENANSCTVKMDKETFNRLLAGNSTIEIESGNNNIEISGDTILLRKLGKKLRYSN